VHAPVAIESAPLTTTVAAARVPAVSLAHLTLPTRFVERTSLFLEETFGFTRGVVPGNSPVEALWLDIGLGQEIHVFYVEGFEVSPFEREFGRHIALFHPLTSFPALKARIISSGGELVEPLRTTPFDRFFFREPVNGYFFEVIDDIRIKSPTLI